MATVGKAALREQLLAARRSVSEDDRARADSALLDHVGALGIDGGIVCAYVPVGTEPGSVELLNLLLCHAERVLLPVARTAADDDALALQWGEYRPGQLVPAKFGLLEPAGPWLPAAAVAEAEVVIVPALAVDRGGARLGRGRGFYDRTLVLRDPHARLIAVVRDEELLDEVPHEPHDVPVTHALTPGQGLVELAN
ncbi:5-formyltetrahydrofolate cyclo-ligase [Mycobacterium sp.]|uniref:5-formyltetrahydrofolate cyclo-ligase n=1 Tax=Mycobacterium sp. TaxID=1785 RepID=UPI002600CB11|nr:5-formyltetrahydrofolate cyclo-ligase [Mycobacterium sp.]